MTHSVRAFGFRALYLALTRGTLLAIATITEPTGAFGSLIRVLARGLPFAAPVLLWLDWRWLKAHSGEVNRWGFRRR